jgi:acyl carrier protein
VASDTLPAEARPQSGLDRAELAGLGEAEARARLEAYLIGLVAAAAKLRAEQLSPTDALDRLGLDSLAAMELKNRLEQDLGVELPLTALLEGRTLAELAAEALRLVRLAETVPPAPAAAADAALVEELLGRLEQLTDEEAAALLAQETLNR